MELPAAIFIQFWFRERKEKKSVLNVVGTENNENINVQQVGGKQKSSGKITTTKKTVFNRSFARKLMKYRKISDATRAALAYERSESSRRADELCALKEAGRAFLCPITMQIPKNPVLCIADEENCTVYEEDAIRRWVKAHKSSPLTRRTVTCEQLVPIKSVSRVIHKAKEKEEMFRSQTDFLLEKMVGCRIRRQFSVVTPRTKLNEAIEVVDMDALQTSDEDSECEETKAQEFSLQHRVRGVPIQSQVQRSHECNARNGDSTNLIVNLDHTDGHVRSYLAKPSLVSHSELKYFLGTITTFDKISGKHCVEYDDGSMHWHHLSCAKCNSKANWRFIRNA